MMSHPSLFSSIGEVIDVMTSTRVVVCSCMRVFLEVNLQTGTWMLRSSGSDSATFHWVTLSLHFLRVSVFSLVEWGNWITPVVSKFLLNKDIFSADTNEEGHCRKRTNMELLWGGRAEGAWSQPPPAPHTSPATDHTPGPLGSFFPFRHACSFSLPGETMQMSLRINQAPRFLFLYTVFLFIF